MTLQSCFKMSRSVNAFNSVKKGGEGKNGFHFILLDSATTRIRAVGRRLSNHNGFRKQKILKFFFPNGPITFIDLRVVSRDFKGCIVEP